MIGAASHVTNCGDPTLLASISTTTNESASGGSRRPKAAPRRTARTPRSSTTATPIAISGVVSGGRGIRPGPGDLERQDLAVVDDLDGGRPRRRSATARPTASGASICRPRPACSATKPRALSPDPATRLTARMPTLSVIATVTTSQRLRDGDHERGDEGRRPHLDPRADRQERGRDARPAGRPEQAGERQRHGDRVDAPEGDRARAARGSRATTTPRCAWCGRAAGRQQHRERRRVEQYDDPEPGLRVPLGAERERGRHGREREDRVDPRHVDAHAHEAVGGVLGPDPVHARDVAERVAHPVEVQPDERRVHEREGEPEGTATGEEPPGAMTSRHGRHAHLPHGHGDEPSRASHVAPRTPRAHPAWRACGATARRSAIEQRADHGRNRLGDVERGDRTPADVRARPTGRLPVHPRPRSRRAR